MQTEDFVIINDILYRHGTKTSGDIVIPDGVTIIGIDAFASCKDLTSVSIPDGVTTIDWGAFEGCNNLSSVTIPESVTSIDYYAFEWCSSLTGIKLPSGISSIEGALRKLIELGELKREGSGKSICYYRLK